MKTIKGVGFFSALAVALLLHATLAASLHAAALTIPMGSLAAARSGDDLILSFPTTSLNFYTVQTATALLGQWSNVQPGIPGDGAVKTVTISNAIPVGHGFYRLLIQSPGVRLLLPQSTAFAFLGHSCGGIQEQVYVTGFDPASGFPIGEVYLKTSCGGSGRDGGGHTTTYSAWVRAEWDFAANVISSATLSNGAAINPTFSATDAYGDVIYNNNTAAYLVVPIPGAPASVSALQTGDQFQVSWTPNGVNPSAVTSSTLSAVPVDSTASILTTTVAGSATTGVIASLQPQTTYQITVVSTAVSGSGPASTPISVATSPATLLPSDPSGVKASWTNLDPTGATDTLVATWQAAVPGDSPIDQYRITIVGSDGSGTFTQTVSGTTLTANFTVDYIPNWSVTVQAHNAVGWGPSSAMVALGGL
jgi:hypothetical protein